MIYTIGTSNRTEEEFFGPLRRNGVKCIVDVRSKPFSRVPLYQKAHLVRACFRNGFDYVYGGAVLGGMNEILSDDPLFRSKLEAVYALEQEHGKVAMFCAEGRPQECHRSYKLGAAMLAYDKVDVTNILRDGQLELVRETLKTTPTQHIDQLALSKL